MANIFADIGRSTAFQTGQGVFRDVMASGELERRGMVDAVNMKHQEDMAVIAKQKASREEAEYQRMNRPTLLSDLVGRGSEKGRPNTMKLFKEAAIMSGAQKITLPDGTEDYTITEHDLPRVQKFMEISKEMRPMVLHAQLNDNREALAELEKQLPKSKDDVEATSITDQIEKIKQANGDILSELRGGKDTQVEKVIGPDGRGIIVPREMSVGMEPYEKPTDQWTAPAPMLIDGKTVMTQTNKVTGQVKSVAQGSTTNVNVDVNTGLSKSARTKAEEDVQEGTDLYTGLSKIIKLSKPEYHTYAGKLQVGAEKVGEKAGLGTDTKMVKGYTEFGVAVEQEFNKYRKWVTGVAAGPVELEMIRKTFPNKDMSRTEFLSAAKQTATNTWKMVERRKRALAAGIMDEKKQKDFYKLVPLDSMPDPPEDVLQRFSPEENGIGREDALAELKRRKVIR